MWRATKIACGILSAAQASAIAGLVVIDELRKMRSVPSLDGYPTVDPEPAQVAGTTIESYMDGESLYADMLTAIDNARHQVYFETFIWKSDGIGQRFKDACIAAAHRGVEVFLIYDAFANLVVDPRFFHFPPHDNLHVLRYSLFHTGRDHRKILVVDGEVGFVGGYNISEKYTTTQWRDTHVRLQGPSVWELENAFVDFWNTHRRRHLPAIADTGARAWDARVSASLNDPRRMLFPVRGLYIDALERARHTAFITSAYFIPDRVIQQALLDAAARNVTIKVLVPEKSNHVIADWVSRAYMTDLVRAGVEVWLYHDVMIHAKTAVVDRRWVTVGTANIDRLSMTGNYEVNLQIHDRDMAAHMEEIFFADLTNATRVDPEVWEQRSLVRRGLERLLKPLGFLI
ncbi:phospholipase D-like domain-containing protein [Nanchangia anserum]|nr:phospholipase D-like domain-containing protein [Nanchangia anserum]